MKENIIITGAYGQDGLILTQILKKFSYNIIGIVKKLNKKRGLKNTNYISLNLNKKLILYDLYVLAEYRKLGIGLEQDYSMKELYFIPPYRRLLRTIRIE